MWFIQHLTIRGAVHSISGNPVARWGHENPFIHLTRMIHHGGTENTVKEEGEKEGRRDREMER